MKTIGLTGGIGSGKTTVANFFASLGAPVYIADDQAKKLLKTSSNVKAKVLENFGEGAYSDGEPDREFLAEKVFKDKVQLEKLNSIIHPAVAADFQEWKQQQNYHYVVYEAAILFESGSYKNCDLTILVTADYAQRIQRILKRDNSTIAEIEARIANQWSDEKKIALADFVINNSELSETRKKVEKIHLFLLQRP